MTSRTAVSFLVRLEPSDSGYAGTVTSVQTGERAVFDGLPELARILERWGDAAPQQEKERS